MNVNVRFALYRAILRAHPDAWISSSEISHMTGVNATQIRRDLSALGHNGKRGMGYSTELLIPILDRALKKHWAQVLDEARHQRALLNLILVETA